MDPSAPGWYPDPTGRHERRYWSGIRWTRYVDDDGRRAEDPLAGDSWSHRDVAVRLPVDESRPGPQPALPAGSPSSRPPPEDRPSFDWRHSQAQPNRRQVLLVVGVVAVVLMLAAAGFALTSDDGATDSTNDDPLRSYLIQYTRRASGETIDDEQASCMSDNVIDAMSRERLAEANVTQLENPLDALTTEEITSFLDAGFECLNNEEVLAYMTATWNAQTGGPPDERKSCILEGLLDSVDRDRTIEVFANLVNAEGLLDVEILTEDELRTFGTIVSDCQQRFPSTTTPSLP